MIKSNFVSELRSSSSKFVLNSSLMGIEIKLDETKSNEVLRNIVGPTAPWHNYAQYGSCSVFKYIISLEAAAPFISKRRTAAYRQSKHKRLSI